MHDNLSIAGKLAGRLPGLLLDAEKVAQSFMKGVHGRRRTGLGETFWQFRPYAPGDSRRDIDWKQSAKRGEPFIRQLEWEASQTLWLWRDASESMDFTSAKGHPSKRDCAEVLLLALAMLALDGGEQVSLLGTDLAPQTHHDSIRRIAETLPRQTQLTTQGRMIAAKAQVILFSDFYFPPEQIAEFCGTLADRQVSGMLVQLCDPAERSLSFNGRVRFQDMESPGESLTIPQVESIRTAYEEKFAAHSESIAAAARAGGWGFKSFSTDVPQETIIAALYDALAVK
jgi:uncharacterized protein (DUF58 family)